MGRDLNAPDLVEELRRRGVILLARGDRLRFHPARAVPAELMDLLRKKKREVMAEVNGRLVIEELSPILETRIKLGAVLLRSQDFGDVWLALDPETEAEIQIEEAARERPVPVLRAVDVVHLKGKSPAAIRSIRDSRLGASACTLRFRRVWNFKQLSVGDVP